MATIKQVANKIGKDLNESYPNIQNLFDVLKRGFKDMENVSGGGGGGSEVDWTQLQVAGTKIAEIEIDGDTTNVYAPKSQTIAVSQIQTTGTKIASISLDGVSTDLYAPNGGGSSSAADVTYDNTDSGLTATNVQDAIDELAAGGGGFVANIAAHIAGTDNVTTTTLAYNGNTYTASGSPASVSVPGIMSMSYTGSYTWTIVCNYDGLMTSAGNPTITITAGTSFTVNLSGIASRDYNISLHA